MHLLTHLVICWMSLLFCREIQNLLKAILTKSLQMMQWCSMGYIGSWTLYTSSISSTVDDTTCLRNRLQQACLHKCLKIMKYKLAWSILATKPNVQIQERLTVTYHLVLLDLHMTMEIKYHNIIFWSSNILAQFT